MATSKAVDAGSMDELLADNHVLVTGPTGSGKDVLMRFIWKNNSHCGLFVNVEGEPVPGAVRVSNPRDLRKKLGEGHRRFDWRPGRITKQTPLLLEAFKDELFRIGDRMRAGRSKIPHWMTVYIAEAHTLSPNYDKEGAVPDLMKRGRKRGIHVVLNTQAPQDLSVVALRECNVWLLFRFSNQVMQYLRGKGLPADDMRDALSQDYHFVLWRNGTDDWTHYDPVPQ